MENRTQLAEMNGAPPPLAYRRRYAEERAARTIFTHSKKGDNRGESAVKKYTAPRRIT